MSVQSIIDNIASAAGIEPQIAERAVGIMLSVMQYERPDLATRLFSTIPGTEELASANDVMTQRSDGSLLGLVSGVVGSFAGEKIGALMKGFAALKASGLTLDQMKRAGMQAIKHIREEDAELAEQLVGHFRGLKGRFGF